MKSENRVELLGHMGIKPEKKFTVRGTPYVRFSLATTYRSRSESGDKLERTTWHTIVAYAALADVIDAYTQTGSTLAVKGRLEPNEYTNKQGVKVKESNIIANDINLLDKRPAAAATTQNEPAPADAAVPEPDSEPEGIPF